MAEEYQKRHSQRDLTLQADYTRPVVIWGSAQTTEALMTMWKAIKRVVHKTCAYNSFHCVSSPMQLGILRCSAVSILFSSCISITRLHPVSSRLFDSRYFQFHIFSTQQV